MLKDIAYDIKEILKRDPAAKSAFEVLLCYPGVHAIIWHKLTHKLYKGNHTVLARIISQIVRFFTGIEIHPGATIGRGVFIDHGMGVVIGETAELKNNVTIYQGVTLGGTGKDIGKRHPTICENVVIGAGAKVLGPFTVHKNAKVGAGAIVLREVPPNCTVVGNPGRIVKRPTAIKDVIDLDQVNLPDPEKNKLDYVAHRLKLLEDCVKHMHDNEACGDCTNKDSSECLVKREDQSYSDDMM